MSNIATLFKISNIDISGGIISNRSALQSTQLNLSWFLIKLYEQANKEWLNMNLIYPFIKSSSNLVLSTKVNKKVYDQIKHEEFKNTYPFNYTPDSRGDLTIMSDNDLEFQRKINNYMECNAKYTWDILIKEMNKHLPVLIKNMEEKIQENTSYIEKISNEIKIKQKKNKFASQSKEIEKEKLEIENLKDDLNHFKEWQSNKDNWHFYHLDTIQKIHDKIVWSRRFSDSAIPKTKKVWPRKHNKKIEYAPLSVRKYSTSSRNTYLKEISKVGFYVYSTNASIWTASITYSSPFSTTASASIKASSDSAFENKTSYVSNSLLNNALNIKTENNLTFGFLNTIEDLINNLKNCENIDNQNLENRKHEIQKYIESEWINIVKNSMSENLTSNLKKVIKFVQESVALANYKRRSKRIIPVLTDTIENLEYVLITFALIISYHKKMGYTALAQIIGNNIIYYYYKNVVKSSSKKR